MPRQARLDAPDTLHHVMVRGIERTAPFRDATDRTDFIARVATLAERGAWTVLAWALLSNHAHLLVRTGSRPLAQCMRSLLTGYAGAFNRRHRRTGHLFQNRYKSIVVEEEPYLPELVRYLHLNPVRAGLVPDLRTLDCYPWTGHSALLGTVPRSWQEVGTILEIFGPTVGRARRAYRAFVAAGIAQGHRPDLQGGGLVRSLGGWAAVRTLGRGREAYTADERVLESSEFVEALRREVDRHTRAAQQTVSPAFSLSVLVRRMGQTLGVASAAMLGPTRTRPATQARQLLAYVWTEVLGRRASDLARATGRTRSNMSWAARQGAIQATGRRADIAFWVRQK